jgi:hypothetical protein
MPCVTALPRDRKRAGGEEVVALAGNVLWEAFKRLPPYGKVVVAVILLLDYLDDDE